jgi:hypothetical protein
MISLLQLVNRTTTHALNAKALKPLEVTTEFIVDATVGLTFSVKMIKPGIILKPSNLETQVQQKQEQITESKSNVLGMLMFGVLII